MISNLRKQQTKKIEYYIDDNEKDKAIKYKSGFYHNILRYICVNIQTTAIVLASINISLGIFYAVFEWFWVLAWFVYLGVVLLFYLVLEIRKDNKKQAEINNKIFDDESDSEKELSKTKSESTQHLKEIPIKEKIKIQPLRYSNSKATNLLTKYQESSFLNSKHFQNTETKNTSLFNSSKINVSYIADNEYDHELKYSDAKKSSLKIKIESLTSSPISSIGIINQTSQEINSKFSIEDNKY